MVAFVLGAGAVFFVGIFMVIVEPALLIAVTVTALGTRARLSGPVKEQVRVSRILLFLPVSVLAAFLWLPVVRIAIH